MSVSADILATYRGPRRVMARHLAGERHEARALAYLLAALALMLVAQVPELRRAAQAGTEAPFGPSLLARALALGVMLPVFYLVAALAHGVARLLGGQGDGFGARLALFWALLAVAPAILAQGALVAITGPGPVASLCAVAVFALFLWFWFAGLAEAEFGEKS